MSNTKLTFNPLSGKFDYIVKETKPVYSWNVTPGVLEEIWSGDSNTAGHDLPRNIFNGSPSSNYGLPSHVNGNPDLVDTSDDWLQNTTNDPSNGSDNIRYSGWLYIEDDNTLIQDVNSNVGEYFRIWINGQIIKETDEVTPNPDLGAGVITNLKKGWYHICVDISVFSAFAGIQLQTSIDNGVSYSNFTGLTSLTTPTLSCREESSSYILQANEFDCPPSVPNTFLAQLPDVNNSFIEALTPLKTGMRIFPSNANSVNIETGSLYLYDIVSKSVTNFSIPETIAATFDIIDIQGNVIQSNVNSFDFTIVNSNGSLTVTTVPTDTDATFQEIFINEQGNVLCLIGQNIYSSLENARESYFNERKTLPSIVDGYINIGGIIARKDTTSLLAVNVFFTSTNKFGEIR